MSQETIHQTAERYRPFRYKLVLRAIVAGAFAGITAILFRLALSKADEFRAYALHLMDASAWLVPVWFLLLLVASVLTTLLLKWEPLISGSGIPQVEGEMEGLVEQKWWRVLLAKFLGSILTLGAGLSLGREGPSIQLGAMAGKGAAQLTRDPDDTRLLMTFGASAGLSAAFNAPFAGVLFALEEVHKRFSADVLVSAMAASLTADFISATVFGLAPVFTFHNVAALPLEALWMPLVLGVLLGCVGALYNRCVAISQSLYAKVTNRWIRTMIPFMVAGVLALVAPQLLGGGHSLAEEISSGLALQTLLLLLVGKFLFSMVSFGSGVPGGIFLPLLVLGALCGGAFDGALEMLGFTDGYLSACVILGMAGMFSAIVRAPVTGIILIGEMTGSFSSFLPAALVSLAAYLTAEFLRAQPIYEQLLARLVSTQKSSS